MNDYPEETSKDGITGFRSEKSSCAGFREMKSLATHLVNLPFACHQPSTNTYITTEQQGSGSCLFLKFLIKQVTLQLLIFPLATQIYPNYKLKDIELLIIKAF